MTEHESTLVDNVAVDEVHVDKQEGKDNHNPISDALPSSIAGKFTSDTSVAADDGDVKKFENMSYDEMSAQIAANFKQLSSILTTPLTPASLSAAGSLATTPDPDISGESAATSPLEASLAEESFESENTIAKKEDLSDDEKRYKITRIFRRAASNGDVAKIKEMLDNTAVRDFINLNAKDEDGTTPLIYAACFGHSEVAFALVEAGAKVDIQDNFGWSALMWATNNNHEALVKVLLEHGASSSQKSSKGRTVFDFVHTDNSKLVDILSHNPRDSISSTSSFGVPGTAESSSSGSSHLGDNDFYFNSTSEDLDNFMAQEAERHRRLVEAAAELGLDVDLGEFDPNYGDDNEDNAEDGEEYDDDEDKGLNPMNDFLWDKCLPDQMFVFSSDDLNYILDTIITNIKLPVKTRQEICVPANVLFLSARFAHYYSSSELLEEVMKGAMDRMTTCVKSNPRNMSTLAFWITNFTQLLYYFKKDTGLVTATAQYHLRLSELVNETYQLIITDAERRIDKILEPAMLEHDQIPGLEEVRFSDDWQRFFKLGNRRSMITPDQATSGANSSVAMKRASSASMMVHSIRQQSLQSTYQEAQSRQVSSFSPRSITTLLSSTLLVLQSYEVHPSIIIQVIAQYFHYISCELFNRILTTKKLLCRSKALQVRMNISYVEDWVRHNNLPASLASYFTPLIQLLQLLQCLSQLSELTLFIDTLKKLDQLNPIQVKRCVVNYRYEVNEPRVPEEIEKYAMQIAEDTVKHKRARSRRSGESQRQSVHTVSSRSSIVSLSALQMQRSDSMSSYASSLQQLVTNTLPAMLASQSESAASTPNPRSATPDADFFNDNASVRSFATTGTAATLATSGMIVGDDNEDDDDTTDVVETKDSKFLLPFSVPTTANMLYITGWGPRYDKEGDGSASGSDDDGEMSKIQREDEERRRKAESERRRREREREAVPVIPDDWMDRLDRTFDRP